MYIPNETAEGVNTGVVLGQGISQQMQQLNNQKIVSDGYQKQDLRRRYFELDDLALSGKLNDEQKHEVRKQQQEMRPGLGMYTDSQGRGHFQNNANAKAITDKNHMNKYIAEDLAYQLRGKAITKDVQDVDEKGNLKFRPVYAQDEKGAVLKGQDGNPIITGQQPVMKQIVTGYDSSKFASLNKDLGLDPNKMSLEEMGQILKNSDNIIRARQQMGDAYIMPPLAANTASDADTHNQIKLSENGRRSTQFTSFGPRNTQPVGVTTLGTGQFGYANANTVPFANNVIAAYNSAPAPNATAQTTTQPTASNVASTINNTQQATTPAQPQPNPNQAQPNPNQAQPNPSQPPASPQNTGMYGPFEPDYVGPMARKEKTPEYRGRYISPTQAEDTYGGPGIYEQGVDNPWIPGSVPGADQFMKKLYSTPLNNGKWGGNIEEAIQYKRALKNDPEALDEITNNPNGPLGQYFNAASEYEKIHKATGDRKGKPRGRR